MPSVKQRMVTKPSATLSSTLFMISILFILYCTLSVTQYSMLAHLDISERRFRRFHNFFLMYVVVISAQLGKKQALFFRIHEEKNLSYCIHSALLTGDLR